MTQEEPNKVRAQITEAEATELADLHTYSEDCQLVIKRFFDEARRMEREHRDNVLDWWSRIRTKYKLDPDVDLCAELGKDGEPSYIKPAVTYSKAKGTPHE